LTNESLAEILSLIKEKHQSEKIDSSGRFFFKKINSLPELPEPDLGKLGHLVAETFIYALRKQAWWGFGNS
jgi:hypothetical protein